MWIERIVEVFLLGVKNLLRNKLRSFLTMLGIIFGVGSVIAMLSVGAGARHEILTQIQELGIRNIIVNSVEPPEEVKPDAEVAWRNRYGLTFKDADYIRKTVPGVGGMLRVNLVKDRTWYRNRRLDASVLGVEPYHLDMFNLKVYRGRPFTQIDSATEAKVCIVRKGLVMQMKAMEDPIGSTLHIGGHPFEIIGILQDEQFTSHTRKALAISDRSQEIYIPYSSSMQAFGTLNYFYTAGKEEHSEVELDQIIVRADSAEAVYPASQMIAALLKRFHDKTDYEIVVPLELLEQSERTQRVFNIVMVLIAGISLLVGGIGIANIMLATITERTKEIGIRRALGARQKDILIQFLTETVAIAALGGLLGCCFGIFGIMGIVKFTQWKALIAPHYVGISLIISCTVGIVFGIFPARRAARMDPITALRHE
jgi:putative ABC transport system permease protein